MKIILLILTIILLGVSCNKQPEMEGVNDPDWISYAEFCLKFDNAWNDLDTLQVDRLINSLADTNLTDEYFYYRAQHIQLKSQLRFFISTEHQYEKLITNITKSAFINYRKNIYSLLILYRHSSIFMKRLSERKEFKYDGTRCFDTVLYNMKDVMVLIKELESLKE